MRRWLALGLPIAALACLAVTAVARPVASRFGAVDRCLAAGRAWNYGRGKCDPLPAGPVDLIVVDKSDRTLVAYRGERPIRSFRIALGRGGLAPKQRQGDGRVPEGSYLISFHNPDSRYHRSLKIDYPTDAQRDAARLSGIDPGGDIMIHGLPNAIGGVGSRHLLRDWTDGCIALTNREIDWLFDAVPDGTRIDIHA